MPELPAVSGQDARRVFERAGWQLRRQHGSHQILVRPGSFVTLSVPDHRELAPGTLRKLIRIAGMTVEEFVTGLSKL